MEGATVERVTLTDGLVDQDRPATGGSLWVDATEERVTDPRRGVTPIDLGHPFGRDTPGRAGIGSAHRWRSWIQPPSGR